MGPAAYSDPPKRPVQIAGQVGSSNVLSIVSDQWGIGNCRRSMEAAKDEELSIEKSIFANVRPAACTGPPKRPVQTTSSAGPFDGLRFASDQRGISSCGMSMEAIVEEELTMGKSISANVRPLDCTGPPKRLAHAANHAGSFDGLRLQVITGNQQLGNVCGGSYGGRIDHGKKHFCKCETSSLH